VIRIKKPSPCKILHTCALMNILPTFVAYVSRIRCTTSKTQPNFAFNFLHAFMGKKPVSLTSMCHSETYFDVQLQIWVLLLIFSCSSPNISNCRNRRSSLCNKTNRYTNFTNIFCHETLHVSDSSSVHHQECIQCTLSNGTCHTGL